MSTLPRLAVHKFASCDGCQLALLNAGDNLLSLTEVVEIVHFAEAGIVAPQAHAEIALVEGSISTNEDLERIRDIRRNSDYLIAMGACATSGGLQALRNFQVDDWVQQLYPQPEFIESLRKTTPISEQVKVDLELWGCPVGSKQVLQAVRALLFDSVPRLEAEKVCQECKRQHAVCVMVTRGEACLGPVTQAGCGAICPRLGRACYACYGPVEAANEGSLVNRLAGFGLLDEAIQQRFSFIHSYHPKNRKWGGHDE